MGKEADILAKIVVVEDDVYMREELLNLLEKSGYDTIGLSDFENAVSEIAAYFPDLILLDINLPFRSGFEICKELKAKQIGTVLVLTARDKLQDELHALDLGADDYLTKPCNMSRLLARIKNLLRRKEEQVQQGLLDGGGFLLDPNTFTIYVGNSSYLMPPNEGKILLALLKNSPKIVSKKELCIRLWGTEEFILGDGRGLLGDEGVAPIVVQPDFADRAEADACGRFALSPKYGKRWFSRINI